MNEFALIKRYFESPRREALKGEASVKQGIGDDCAVLSADANEETVITTDTLVAGVHVPEQASPRLIAERALRVNLSDIAAMGARPMWYLLALTLPDLDENWLEEFSRGLQEASDKFDCSLVGGDTTRGPLTITITMLGTVPTGKAVLRSGARIGDGVYVTGCLGDASAGLRIMQGGSTKAELDANDAEFLLDRFWRPSPRISEGLAIRSFASAAIDISDGLLADLGHITTASGVAAELTLDMIPLSEPLTNTVDNSELMSIALTGGDDYELCFTVCPDKQASVESVLARSNIMARKIGDIVQGSGVVCLDSNGLASEFPLPGYQHF